MFGSRIVSLAAALYLYGWSIQAVVAQSPPVDVATQEWSDDGWPLLQEFCLDCHNADYQEAELDLSGFKSLGKLVDNGGGGSMQRVLEMVRFGAMPPDDAYQPTPEQRKLLVSSLDRTMFAVSCDLRPRPGKVTARRLNKAEYNHSIRDLFGMDLRPAVTFPSDEVGAGFDNNGDVLSLSPMQVEKYLDAAEKVSQQVVIDPETLPSIDAERSGDRLAVHGETKTGSFYGRFLEVGGFVWADFEVPVAGEYRIRVRAGNSEEDRDPSSFAVYDESGVLLGHDKLKYYGSSGGSQRFDFTASLKPGKQRFFVLPHGEKPEDFEVGETQSDQIANLDEATIAAAEKRREERLRPDRGFDKSEYPFMVREIEVEGPTKRDVDPFPKSHHEIVRRVARLDDDKWSKVEESAAECLKPLMRRVFRGPVSDADVERYAALVKGSTDRGESYYRGLQIAVSAVLVSPRFLFRVESPPDDFEQDEDGSVRLTQHQLATRLSYFLWSSTPDEALLKDADDGKLDDQAIERHVRRMIEDDKAESLAHQFAAQWLGLRDLEQHEADIEKFSAFTPTLRAAMARETELAFMDVVRANRPVASLLTSDSSFVNQELAEHYGLSGVDGDQFQRVSLAGTPRRGLLSHASVLTLTSNPGRTSPVRRGKWILENVLGTPPPEPPAGVPELEENETASAGASLREQLEIHRADPTCAACHRVMDQLGFGLEQYDAIGRFRDQEGGTPIDASGEVPGGRTFNGAAELSAMLSKTESEAFAKTVVARLMTFAIGRQLSPTDRCTVDEIVASTADQDYRFIDLVLEVVRSRPFQFYEWTPPSNSTADASTADASTVSHSTPSNSTPSNSTPSNSTPSNSTPSGSAGNR